MNVQFSSPTSVGNQSIAEQLITALRQVQVETTKAQIYHWNITGPLFVPLHSLFQEIYEDHFSAQDQLAERLRAMRHFVDGRLVCAVQTSTICECDGEINAMEMVQKLAEDQANLSLTMRNIVRVAEENGDPVTADLAIERADQHDKFAWMLTAHKERSD